jgi:hypothetical protein
MTEPILTCDAVDALFLDYLEELLSVETRAAVDAHLHGCRRCAALVHDVRAIQREARALPALAPTHDLWAGIEARIAPTVIPFAAPPARTPRRVWRIAPRATTGWLAAAAALLIAATAGVTYQVTKSEYRAPASAPTAVVAPTGNGLARTVANSPAEATYDREIAQLRGTLQARRSELDPGTVAVIERNLRVIDAAIAESRAALARDPASTFLRTQLTTVLGQKVELLRTAALLPSRT